MIRKQTPFEASQNDDLMITEVKLDRVLGIIGGLSQAMTERVEEAKKLVQEFKTKEN